MTDHWLEALGVRYALPMEWSEDDLDWLDRVLLRILVVPRPIQEVVRNLGLPQRLVQDALAQLIERHLVLLDVREGTLQSSGAPRPARWRRAARPLSIWQDHVSGTIVPFDRIKAWTRRPAEGAIERLRGGPPDRTPRLMSDAELLAYLERQDASLCQVDRVGERERAGLVSVYVPVVLRPDGRFAIVETHEPRMPSVLWRAWERQQPKVIEPRGTISELPIPDRWEQQIGEWRDEINERIREIAASPGRLSRRQPSIAADRLRAVIQTNLRVRYCEAGATEVAGVASRAVRRIHIRVGSSRGSVGDAIALARKARCPERVVLSAETASDKNKLSAKKEFVEILLDGRKDVDMIVADDMTAVMGGGGPGVSSPAIVVEAARPLRGFLHEQLSESAEPSPQGQEAGERILGRLAEIEQALDAAAFGGYAGAVAGERALQLIAAASDELEASLRATEYREARWIEPTELESWLQGEPKGPLRIVARDARSPLLVACRGRGEVTTCVVWARTKPVGAGGTRWVEMDGPCEVLLVGDAVVIGEWTSPDPKGVPSFLAIRDPQLASAIRQATNSAVVL